MAKKKPSALDALTRLNEERRVLEIRGADVRRAAALELGHAVLDAGGGALGIARLKELVTSAIASDPMPPAKPGEASHG